MRRMVGGRFCLVIAAVLALLGLAASAGHSRANDVRADIPEDAYRLSGPHRQRGHRPLPAVPLTTTFDTLDVTPVSTAMQYTVEPGDTLWSISMHFGVGLAFITKANNLDEYSYITPGMELTLPMSNPEGTAQAGPDAPIVSGQGLHFVASVAARTCWLFLDSNVVGRWTCSPGRVESPSALGNYTIQSRLERAYSIPADAWMPYWLGIYDAGKYENGIHGLPFSAETGETYWEDLVGTPITFGCIMLENDVARRLFDIAYVGMPVTILP